VGGSPQLEAPPNKRLKLAARVGYWM